MEKGKQNLGITYGAISGLVSVVLTLVFYLGGVKWFTNPIAYAAFAIPIIFAVVAGLKQKKMNGGYLEFKEALKVVFTTFVIAALIGTVFNYVLFNIIDVPFREALTQEIAMTSQKFMQRFNVPQEEIDKQVEKILKGNSFSLGTMLLNFAYGCIFWFIVSLIIAAIIKKKRPEFPEATV